MSAQPVGSRFVGWLARSLEAEEREFVLGDIAEEGAGFVSSSVSISNFALRRELAKWSSATPWLMFFGVLLPCVLLLIGVARKFADRSAIYIWIFANNSDINLLRQPGFWFGVSEFLPRFIFSGLALMSWSWCSGYLIGSSSRSTFRSNAVLVCVLGGLALLGWTPSILHAMTSEQARAFAGNAAVFRNSFYRVAFPKITLLALVLVPLLRGISDAQRRNRATEAWRQILSASLIGLALCSLGAQVFAPGLHVPIYQMSIVGLAAYSVSRPWSRSEQISQSID